MGVLGRVESGILSKCKNKNFVLLYKFIKWSIIYLLCWKLLKLGLMDLVNWAEPREGYVYLLIIQKTPGIIGFFDGIFAVLIVSIFLLFVLAILGILIQPGKKREAKPPIQKEERLATEKPTPEMNENMFLKIVAYASIVVVVLGALSWVGNVVLEGGEDSVNVDIIDSQYRYNEVEITFQTYNEGFFSARNVKVKISVIEDTGERGKNYNKLATGDILGSKTYFVGTIKGGESKTNTVTVRLDESPARISTYAQIVK